MGTKKKKAAPKRQWARKATDPVEWREGAHRVRPSILPDDLEVDRDVPLLRKSDAIRPAHYKAGDFECIDVIEALGHGHSFCIGNAIKYLFRADRKPNGLEDLKKARWYVDRAIERLES